MISFLQIQRERSDFRESAITAARQITENNSVLIQDVLEGPNPVLVSFFIERAASQPQVLRARIFDLDGNVLADSGEGEFSASIDDVTSSVHPGPAQVTLNGDIAEVCRLFQIDGQPDAVLQLSVNTIQVGTLNDAIKEIVWQAVLLLVGAIFITVILARFITAPIKRLNTAANRIADGDLEFSTATTRRDELGALSNAFDEMRMSLASARAQVQVGNEALAVASRELEEEVRQREGAERAVRTRAEVNFVLAEIGKLMTSTLEIEDVYERFAALTNRLLPFDRIAIAAVDVEAETLTTTYESGINVPAWGPGQTRPLFKPLAAMILESPSAVLMDQELAEWVVTEYPEMQDILDAGLVSTLAVPIFARDQPIAFMAVNSRDPEAYTADDAELAEQIVAQIAGVLANMELRTELQREVEVRSTQAEIGRLVSSSTELADTYRTLAALIRGLVPFDRVVISRVDTPAGKVTCEYVDGVPIPGAAERDTVPLANTAIESAASDRRALRLQADPDSPEAATGTLSDHIQHGLMSLVIAPLFSQARVIGAITVSSKRRDTFSDEDVDLLERIAAQVGGAIGVAQLHAQIQAESEEQVHRLEDLDALRVQFLQMVTHEFRTPLSSLRVSRDLLAEADVEDLDRNAYIRLITNMGRGVDRIDTLVSDLLDLTIAQAGELNLNLELTYPATLIENSIEVVSPLAAQRDQSFVPEVAPSLPRISMDTQRIEQVLINLLSNAQKYSDDAAEINVAASNVDGFVEFRVTGRGPDIPEQDRPHMFEPFFRGSGPNTRSIPGRGLGLSIAKAFVELHGGNIGFDSVPGRGPSFYFRLPAE